MDQMVYKNIDLAWKNMSNKGRILPFSGKRSCLKRIRGYNTWKEEGGSRYSY